MAIFCFAIFGCDDEDFLVENPKSFYTSDNVFSSPAQVDQVLITLYSKLRSFRLTNLAIKGMGTDTSDAPFFRISSSLGDYSQLNPESAVYRDIFNFHYELIGIANTAIMAANLDNIVFESEDEKNYIIAQAVFFRAYAHGMLAELFGGVSIVNELVDEARFDYARSTREEVYQFAISELESIINDLPETTDQGGRLVRGAAQHYLSEFYLALGTETGNNTDFQQSIDYASAIIDGGTYALMTSRFGTRMDEAGKDVWWDLWQKGNINYSDGNTESIWTFQVDFDAFLAGDTGASLNYPRYHMPVYRAIPGVTGVAEDVGGRGVSFVAPSPLMKDIIWEGPLEVTDQRNAEHNIQRTVYYNDESAVEPALIGTPVPQAVLDEANDPQGWIYPIFWKLSTDEFLGLDQGQNRSNLFRDEYAIRLPETILLRAEAHYRMGNSQLAADDINIIRARVNATAITSSDVDIDYILDERARELFVEESRWNTLLRMGGTVAVDRLREFALNDITRTTLTFDFNLWPIPQSVIDRNKDVKWEQNSGW